jgi:pantetheine-phosphate adenylyltransferase
MMHSKTGFFPGSFDPFTKGHEDIVRQSLELFDQVIIGMGVNEEKKYLFDEQKRVEHIRSIFESDTRVTVISYSGLTTDKAKQMGAQFLIRGLRDSRDFSYERAIAHMNDQMSGIKSIFFLTRPEFGAINSTIVREIFKNGGKIDAFVTNAQSLVSGL